METKSGHSHSCRQIDQYNWRISWCYDYLPKGVSWRATKRIVRDADEAGAKRFCSKWWI